MQRFPSSVFLLVAAGALFAISGCKYFEQPVQAHTDAQLASDVQTKLSADPALSGDKAQVYVAVNNGVAKLSGTAPDDSTRQQAATEAGEVPGVKQVENDLTVPANGSATEPATQTADSAPADNSGNSTPSRPRHFRSPGESAQGVPAPGTPPPPVMYAGAPVVVGPPVVVAPVRPVYPYVYYGPHHHHVHPYAYYAPAPRPGVGVGVGVYIH